MGRNVLIREQGGWDPVGDSEPNCLVPIAAYTARPIPNVSCQDPDIPQKALRASPAPTIPWKASSEWGNHLLKAFCHHLQGFAPKPSPSKSLSPHPTRRTGGSSITVLQKHRPGTCRPTSSSSLRGIFSCFHLIFSSTDLGGCQFLTPCFVAGAQCCTLTAPSADTEPCCGSPITET